MGFGWLENMDWVTAVPAIVTVANVITAATPTKADNAVLNFGLRILNLFAMNFGMNRNADDV